MTASVAFDGVLGFTLVSGDTNVDFTTHRRRLPQPHTRRRMEAAGFRLGPGDLDIDDVDAIYEHARAAGLRPETTPANAPWGEQHFHLHDPDGHELSFARPLRTDRSRPVRMKAVDRHRPGRDLP